MNAWILAERMMNESPGSCALCHQNNGTLYPFQTARSNQRVPVICRDCIEGIADLEHLIRKGLKPQDINPDGSMKGAA